MSKAAQSAQPQGPAPTVGFLRLPAVLALYPVGRSSWWQAVREGRAPRPVKLGPATTAWRAADIMAFLEEKSKESNDQRQAPRP